MAEREDWMKLKSLVQRAINTYNDVTSYGDIETDIRLPEEWFLEAISIMNGMKRLKPKHEK